MGQKSTNRHVSTALQVAATVVNAALYASIGILTYFGIFAPPPIGIVRFWPVVIIPGVFATLFGPWVGGIGAAMGIFASDMVAHGNPLLSLTVGVTSNFVGFFLLGYIAQKNINPRRAAMAFVVGTLIVIGGVFSILFYLPETFAFTNLSTVESALLFLAAVGGSFAILTIVAAMRPEWKSYGIASVVGLGVGSAIIGLGLWAWTQFFLLGELSNAPFYFSLLWFVWTFTTEIPFLLILGPPILKACYRAFPWLEPQRKE